ncbi:hypothetical protein DOTSEDRAFT_24322 [Dothistroma septosporum NZE10]|uniref:Uncharacterized protein n=1 Tax=Dothistroma septosporum (strain NZE10 / CBS 128990) TaxID=675120 RepID=N1PLM9_DOTSN|nr:hypothetical protein DOTSEDRAFT_24322 [Dothistroma septosporum NZE10]
MASGAPEDSFVERERKKHKSGETTWELPNSVSPAVDEDHVVVPPAGTDQRASTTGMVRSFERPGHEGEDAMNHSSDDSAPALEIGSRTSNMATDNVKRARKTAPRGPLGHK